MENVKSTDTGKEAGKLHLIISTPVGKWQHPFDPQTTVREVIEQILEHFKNSLEPGNYELRAQGSSTGLQREETLAANQIGDKTDLILVPETGGGK